MTQLSSTNAMPGIGFGHGAAGGPCERSVKVHLH